MTTAEKAYIAGIIDGEGWMGLVSDGKGRNRRPQIEVESTDRELTLWLHEKAGGYNPRSREPRNDRQKAIHRWRVGGPKAKRLLVEVLPYIVIERRRIRAMELLGHRTGLEN
jgi:hypothetical protein